MTRRGNSFHKNGYLRVTTLANLGKPTDDRPSSKRTPFDLTTNELLKKLCQKGPEGCGTECGNWDLCLYGHAWKERLKTLKVKANITLIKGEKITRYFIGMEDAVAWADRHMGHYKRFDAEEIKEEETDKDSVEADNG